MSINKYTLMFLYGNYKWSESYWNTADESVRAPAAVTKAQNLASTRAGLMGTGVTIQAVRISGGVGRRNTFIAYNGDPNSKDNFWKAPTWTSLLPVAFATADNPGNAVLVRYELGQFNFATKEMSGFPDSDITGPQSFSLGSSTSDSVNLNSAWSAWRTFITDGSWTIRTQVSGASSTITACAPNAQGFMEVTLTNTIGAGFDSYVRLSKVQGSRPFGKLNGVYRVTQNNALVLTLSPKRNVPTGWTFTPSGICYYTTYTQTAIDDVALQYVAIKKRGDRGFRGTKGKATKRT